MSASRPKTVKKAAVIPSGATSSGQNGAGQGSNATKSAGSSKFQPTYAPKPKLVVPPPPSRQPKSNAGPSRSVTKPAWIQQVTEVSSGDEDEFEEVSIPTKPPLGGSNASAGPSSPYPGTPNTHGTARTGATTPATMTAGETDEDPYGADDDDDNNEEDDGVIRLEIGGETPEEKAKRIAMAMRKKPMTSKDRAVRIEVHKMHVLALLASMRIRNRWANNLLLKARLLSLLPHPLVSAFTIPPSRFPDRAQRTRLFLDALQSLVTWWSQTFFDVPDSTIGLRTRPWDEVQDIIEKLPGLTRADLLPGGAVVSSNKKGKEKEKEDDERIEQYETGAGGERLRTVKSLMKKGLLQAGSRDVSAILFVSLCRACGLGARLVISLQAVPWRAEKVVVKKMSGAGKGGRSLASRQGDGPGDDEEDSMEEVPMPGEDEEDAEAGEGGPGQIMEKIKRPKIRAAGRRRQQDPAEVYRLRKSKPAPQTVGGKPKPKTRLELSVQPPVLWAEIFSRSEQRWTPVDPVRGTIRRKTHYEPSSDNGPIRMSYVVAFEEDGYARDVTLRYTRSFGAKTAKLRAPQRKDEPDWWELVLGSLARPYRLNRDELEDAELETSQVSEAMPLHLNGFKDHPLFVLERHLKREEVIQPKREVGKFRGEPVYRRANVLSCKTAENWMRVGRKVKDAQQPLKWVKQRAMTLNRRREVELARQSGEEQMQGLYAEYQTLVYRPPPIRDGIIPQNAFGNIDLYAPTMLPDGARHLPYKGIAKIAKQLDIPYAEACTGFDFKKQRAIPVITGIVVAEEQAETVLDAYWESAAAAEERERQKRVEKALKRWAKLINAVRVRDRLRATYGDQQGTDENSHNPLADPGDQPKVKPPARSAQSVLTSTNQAGNAAWLDRFKGKSASPTPSLEEVEVPESISRPATSLTAKQTIESAGAMDDEEDMEEVEVPTEASNGKRASAPPVQEDVKPHRTGTLNRPYFVEDMSSTEDDDPAIRPARSNRKMQTRVKVDNPYEESDADETAPELLSKDRKVNGQNGSVDVEVDGRVEAFEEEDQDGDEDLNEVQVIREATPPTTRSGRKVKLRIGRIVEEPDRTEKRVTRSSKRRR